MPRKPINELLRVPDPAIKKIPAQIIPVTYLGIERNNSPSDLQGTTHLAISGPYFPSFAVDTLYRILNISKSLDTQYIYLILRSKSIAKPLKSTILAALSNLVSTRRSTKTTALQYVKNLKQVSRYTHEEFRPWCPRNSFV